MQALKELELLDTPAEECFDALARLAAHVLDVPVAAISLVDRSRQWFKSKVGFDTLELPREHAFCAHTILGDGPLLVADATLDERFVDNPLVTGDFHLRAYAGVPLRTSDGHAVGALCAIDQKPRTFDSKQLQLLQDVADLIRREFMSREAAARARKLADDSQQAATQAESLYRATFDRAAIGIAIVGLDGSWLRINSTLCRTLGRSAETLMQMTFQDITHPEDLDTDLGLIRQLLAGDSDHYALDKRYLRGDGAIVWGNLTVTLVRDAGGQPLHFVSVVEDITERRATEDALRQLRFQLEERVEERTAELQRSQELLADKESDLRAVLTHAHDAYICFDASGLVVDWNRQAETTFGWLRSEAVGRRIDDLIIPEAQRRARSGTGPLGLSPSHLSLVLNQRLELSTARREGRVFPCEISVTELSSRKNGKQYALFLRDISRRKEHEKRLAEASERLTDLYQNSPCGYYSLDAQGRFVQINETSLHLFGVGRDSLVGVRSPKEFFTPQGQDRFAEVYPIFMKTGRFGPEEFDLVCGDGQRRRVNIMATALRDADGRFLRSRTVMIDVTELHKTRQALEAIYHQQNLMLDNELFGIIKTRDRRVAWVNKAAAQLLGYEPDELVGQSLRKIHPTDEAFRKAGVRAYGSMASTGRYREQLEVVNKKGQPIWIDISGAPLHDGTGESLWMMLDISVMKDYQARVEALAYHDNLTGLPNRLLLMDRLTQAISAASRTGNHVAVCFGDLDGFKAVNDRHGHDAGDALLCEVAKRLRTALRAHDTIARLGGDEFVLVLTQLGTSTEHEAVLARAVEAISQPFDVAPGVPATVGASFGVARVGIDGTDAAQLIAHADKAMYEAKRRSKLARPLKLAAY